jgi:hypothetical protein
MSKQVSLAVFLVFVGIALVIAIPTPAEGPLLVSISDKHGIRLVDAIGLALGIPSWLYLNLLALRFLIKRLKSNS